MDRKGETKQTKGNLSHQTNDWTKSCRDLELNYPTISVANIWRESE